MIPKTALIIGISGQDGAYLTHHLLHRGYQVHGTSRDVDGRAFANLKRLGVRDKVKLHSVSASDFRGVLSTIENVEPTEIYNLSGQSSVALSFEQPIETFESITTATVNILECIRFLKKPIRFLNTVSTECFGNTDIRADESTPFQPSSPYAMAKAAAFWATRTYREAYGLYCSSAILSNHESPLRPERFVCRKIVSAAVRIAAGSPEKLHLGNTTVIRDWGYAGEYMDAAWRILQQPKPEDFVIATGHSHSLTDVVNMVFAAVGLNAADHVTTDNALLRPLDHRASRLNPSHAEEVLGWKAHISIGELARILVDAEQNGGYGPLPWVKDGAQA